MKFLVDAQLPPASAQWLRDWGHEAKHVGDVGLGSAKDSAIWDYVLREGMVIVTKDDDFAERSVRAPQSPQIVWLRVGNATNRALRAWFERRFPGIVRLLEQGNRLVEVI